MSHVLASVLKTDPNWALLPREGTEAAIVTARSIGLTMMAVSIDPVPTFKPGSPVALFRGPYHVGGEFRRPYDVAPDGQRFLMLKEAASANTPVGQPNTVIVQNWFEELTRLVQTDQ